MASLSDEPRKGMALPPLDKGPLTSSRIARWCAAQENWDKIHYDSDYATKVAGLPGSVINGALKQHILSQLIEAALGDRFWLWRLAFRFTGLDLVGHSLVASGRIEEVGERGGMQVVEAEVWITNTSTGEITTAGRATLLRREDGQTVLDATGLADERPAAAPDTGADASGLPEEITAKVGQVIEEIESYGVIEAGRLRLFAEALGDVPPVHFDAAAGSRSPFGHVVAMPLFPIHALSLRPGQRELSVAPEAMGREGVCEIGRDLASLFGLGLTGGLNGGNRVQVHSLAAPGDRVCARSRLIGARKRQGKRGGNMLILETENEYWTDRQVPLLTEQQTSIFRHTDQTPT